jgi:hypothetical protein
MKLRYQETDLRAKKDERPIPTIGGRNWKTVNFLLDGVETEGMIAKDWLYFARDGQWYKLDTRAAGIDLHQEIDLTTREVPKQSLEDKRARRQARRRERRAAKKAATPTPDYSEDLE